MAQQTENKGQERKEAVLLKDHTHYGKPHKAGDKIKVTESEEHWLIQQKIIKG